MNPQLESSFRFRGQRPYLHSTTIFDFLLAQDPQPENIDFSFHRMTDRQCTILAEEDESLRETLIATYRSVGAQWFLYQKDEEITERYPCNEADICARVDFADASAEFEMPPIPGASYLESVVGVYKQMLLKLFPDPSGLLVFVRVTLREVPTTGRCKVEHRRKMGDEFFQSQLTASDQSLGKLIFALQ